MKDENRTSQTGAGQGADEQHSETYKKYDERAAQSATQHSPVSTGGVSGSDAKQASVVRRSILFLEDEPFIGELYNRAMVKAGYNVKIVRDGAEGLKEIMSGVYDIVLLDIMMPNMLGLDILKKIRADMPDLKTKIIITTNLEQSKEHRAAIEKQADGYLIKAEVTPREMVEFLSHIK